jgi:hypothetical protein
MRTPAVMKVGVTGHRTLHATPALRRTVRRALTMASACAPDDHAPIQLLSPLAEGADRLVAQECLRRTRFHLKALLPMSPRLYRQDFATSSSRRQFDRLLDRARSQVIVGAASRRRAYVRVGQTLVRECDLLLALWDGRAARGPGGTGDMVRYARRKGKPLLWIHTSPPHGIIAERLPHPVRGTAATARR